MKNYFLFVLLLFGLAACTGAAPEEGAAPPIVYLPTTAPIVLSPTPTVNDPATALPVVTLATATAQPPAATAGPPTETPMPPPATPLPTTAPAEPSPTRIQFATGASSATISGHLAAGESIEYLAWGAAGQWTHVELTSADNVANFAFVGQSDGQPYKRLENEHRFWDGALPINQDYLIRLHTLTTTEFTLILTIEPLDSIVQPLWPVVDGLTGFLLGGSHNGEWVDPFVALKSLQDGARPYQVYTGNGFWGTATGQPPAMPWAGPCGGTPVVAFAPGLDLTGAIAIVAPWEAAPRQPEALSPDNAEYQNAVGELLAAQGIAEPVIELTAVQRIDLEGDGVDEVLIVANHLTGLGNGLPAANAGDYSLVALRQVVNGVVQTTLLASNIYPEAAELVDPVQYNLLALLDLNGNSQLEIVVEGWQYEGRFVMVFELLNGAVSLALTAGCSQ
ncbi:MAG: hypothetical protein KDE59_30620 [Anaerolineales bacterium]|nr:hypothetical protein [Anaerolineales bacterium]